MANITIYLPDEVEKRVREAAAVEGAPVSRWVAKRLAEFVESAWPTEFLELAGAFPDFPEASDLRERYGPDAVREPLE
jgi:hypothetical protein